jgi:hypothetical protein
VLSDFRWLRRFCSTKEMVIDIMKGMKSPIPNIPRQPTRPAAPPVYRPTLQAKPASLVNACLPVLRNGTRALVPHPSTTIQRLPKTHSQYGKWKIRTEAHNTAHPAFTINFEKKWGEAADVKDFIGALQNQGKIAVAALAPRPQGPLVQLPPKTPSRPVTPPRVPAPAPPAPRPREEEIVRTLFRAPPLPTGATSAPIIVNPLDGLSSNVRIWAQGIQNWNQNTGMDGIGAVTMARAEQEELTNWVLSRRTSAGKQKFGVIIGAGSGAYSGTTQYKVVGRQHGTGGTAITYHISLATSSYKPTDLPAHFGF